VTDHQRLIDLHVHTTASDGTCSPEDLVSLAAQLNIGTIGITDHDTMDAVGPATTAANRCRINVVPGIEITAVHDGRDVHVLGYFVDPTSNRLQQLCRNIRAARVDRAREIAERLSAVGAPIDVGALLASASAGNGKALARPQIARALVAAGHVESVAMAFELYLGESCAAYVPHHGPSPAEVIEIVAEAGGVTSLAHPGTLNRDDLIPRLCAAGLDAIEAYHSAHSIEQAIGYQGLARALGLAVTGGSDFHGPHARRAEHFGRISLPDEDFRRFSQVANRNRALN
jgi:predicted metal-dependent phosphoesterase TrpH